MSRSKVLIEKINARVFCHLNKGGNPVTIFTCSPEQSLPMSTSLVPSSSSTSSTLPPTAWQSRLAQSCEWESVIVDPQSKTMAFYMPTGEQVSFCAHAAMGGAATSLMNASDLTSVSFAAATEPEQLYTATEVTAESINENHDGEGNDDNPEAEINSGKFISLQFTGVDYTEIPLQHPPLLYRILREYFGLTTRELDLPAVAFSLYPRFCNVSVARPKTLVYVNSVDRLNALHRSANITDEHFRQACDALQSTGIYFYTEADETEHYIKKKDEKDDTLFWQCRQFPRASGYPEDPATGIAAAAFAVSLAKRSALSTIKCYQGFAMGKPSLVTIQDVELVETTTPITTTTTTTTTSTSTNNTTKHRGRGKHKNTDNKSTTTTTTTTQAITTTKASFRLIGQVQVDDSETIEVSLDE